MSFVAISTAIFGPLLLPCAEESQLGQCVAALEEGGDQYFSIPKF